MELVMLVVALFCFLFGSVLVHKSIDFAFLVGDKFMDAVCAILKMPFYLVYKLICFTGNLIAKRLARRKSDEYTIRPIYDVSPLEIQQMRRQHKLRSGQRMPVQIEYPQQSTK